MLQISAFFCLLSFFVTGWWPSGLHPSPWVCGDSCGACAWWWVRPLSQDTHTLLLCNCDRLWPGNIIAVYCQSFLFSSSLLTPFPPFQPKNMTLMATSLRSSPQMKLTTSSKLLQAKKERSGSKRCRQCQKVENKRSSAAVEYVPVIVETLDCRKAHLKHL